MEVDMENMINEASNSDMIWSLSRWKSLDIIDKLKR